MTETKLKGGWQRPRQVVVNKSTAQLREKKATKKFMNKYPEIFQGPRGPHDDSSGVFAEGGGWPNAANEQSRNDGRTSSQEGSDQNTHDGILGPGEPEKQVSDVALQTDTCNTLYVTKNTFTAYTIAIVQNSQALQYDQMHVALQSAQNQSSLETPLKAEELMTAHFN